MSGADSSLNHHRVIFLKALKRDPNSLVPTCSNTEREGVGMGLMATVQEQEQQEPACPVAGAPALRAAPVGEEARYLLLKPNPPGGRLPSWAPGVCLGKHIRKDRREGLFFFF